MLSKPKNGWAKIKIGTFEREVGCLTAVPNDLLKAFINFFENGAGVASFECEPYEFDLVFSYTFTGGGKGTAYVIDSEQKLIYEGISVIELAKEFVADIKNNLVAWSRWKPDSPIKSEYKTAEQKKQVLLEDIEKLEKFIKK